MNLLGLAVLALTGCQAAATVAAAYCRCIAIKNGKGTARIDLDAGAGLDSLAEVTYGQLVEASTTAIVRCLLPSVGGSRREPQ